MPDNHYIDPRLVELYDVDSGWSVDRDFYLSLAGPERQKILDLGCGTGLICNAYAAAKHDVTGADPSPAMLQAARRKPHGGEIEWIEASAQSFKSDKIFDLIIMTGHAFQVLLEDIDISQTFNVMQKHLQQNGTIAFESRNPFIEWKKEWDYDMVLDLPSGRVCESRRYISMVDERMTFELCYQFSQERLLSLSELRFACRSKIEELLNASGLRVERLLGDWDGRLFDEASSPEMIFIARLAN